MSWIQKDYQYSTIERICLNVIKYGSIPKHVAFIMDGNRRFANEKLLRKCDGHLEGFSKLSEVLRWCSDLGIEEVSVFAFSIENFKRAAEEVTFLMNLAEEKLKELYDKNNDLLANGVCVRIIGNLSLLPTRIQQLAARIMLQTKNNSKHVLNICMAYTSRDEIMQAVETARNGVKEGIIIPSDITPQLLSKCMYMRLSKPLDLLVRTSGEVRLSDFLTWQAAENGAVYQFVGNYWPSFSFWDLVLSIVNYQLYRFKSSSTTPEKSNCLTHDQLDDEKRLRTDRFLQFVDKSFWETLSGLI